MIYAYPAIFTPEVEGGFSGVFPDLESCYTCGDNMADALIMAEDVLALTLYGYEKEHKTIPAPSQRKEIDTEDESFVNFVSCDTLEYRKKFSNKKDSLSILFCYILSAIFLYSQNNVKITSKSHLFHVIFYLPPSLHIPVSVATTASEVFLFEPPDI